MHKGVFLYKTQCCYVSLFGSTRIQGITPLFSGFWFTGSLEQLNVVVMIKQGEKSPKAKATLVVFDLGQF
jgi:hypothetical protein